jgi:hypothetical protein
MTRAGAPAASPASALRPPAAIRGLALDCTRRDGSGRAADVRAFGSRSPKEPTPQARASARGAAASRRSPIAQLPRPSAGGLSAVPPQTGSHLLRGDSPARYRTPRRRAQVERDETRRTDGPSSGNSRSDQSLSGLSRKTRRYASAQHVALGSLYEERIRRRRARRSAFATSAVVLVREVPPRSGSELLNARSPGSATSSASFCSDQTHS